MPAKFTLSVQVSSMTWTTPLFETGALIANHARVLLFDYGWTSGEAI